MIIEIEKKVNGLFEAKKEKFHKMIKNLMAVKQNTKIITNIDKEKNLKVLFKKQFLQSLSISQVIKNMNFLFHYKNNENLTS